VKGLLVRVGIDSTDGSWNAPMRLISGEFAYVTIKESMSRQLRSSFARYYDEFVPVAASFDEQLPRALLGMPTHLDPDFDYLTYGDQGQRGKRIVTLLKAGDLLAFFAALRPVDGPSRPLVYAIIGLYMVNEIVSAVSVPEGRWRENAHTRRVPIDGEIVVRARAGFSGRLRRCIPIGELRGGVYRVREDLLEAWGGLGVKDGYIQRSARLPEFKDASKFYHWFLTQQPELAAQNNPK
jgi:Nucleotide modification associated domain 3